MKNLILISLFGLMFSQAELTTRVYTFPINMESDGIIPLDIQEITGYDLEVAMISIFHIKNFTSYDTVSKLYIEQLYYDLGGNESYSPNSVYIYGDGVNSVIYNWTSVASATYFGEGTVRLRQAGQGFDGDITISVTAEFPIEDTGYIEEGFDFCLVPGYNLVSYPCENFVSVQTALPELALNELSAMIGQGVATTNFNGQWVGNLNSFEPGAGYWFKANSSFCFNYACAE